jgi:hypothetical protein
MNTATVTLTGQSESDTSNSTATDPTTIVTFAETFSSTSLLFPDQLVGAGSAAQAVMLTNVGTGALQIDSVAASGDFVQTNECGSSVAVGATCTISITFTPTVPGKRTGSVTVTDNAAGSPHAISLSGTGIAPQASLSPSSLTFTSQYVGTSGLPQNITITNTGTAPLTIANVQASSSFGETSGCTSSLAVNVSCTIGVFFDPTASGQVAGSLTITDNGVGSPQTVSLSGVGEDFSFTLASNSSTSATVAPGQMATFTMLLSPGGGFNHTVSLACTGAPISSSCTAAPGVVTLNPNGPTAVIISVPTTAASTVAPFRWLPPLTPRQNGWPLFLCLGISLMIAALGLAVRSGRGRAPARRVALLLVAVAVLIAPALMSCGGAPMAHSPGTPGGIYTLNVAATFSSGTIQLTHNVQLTLTVR